MTSTPVPAHAEDACVRFEEISTPGGYRLGVAQLNSERSLNALSLDMIRLLYPQLRRWAEDPNIACVILHGAGEKAFCAGGDIRSLYKALKAHAGPTALDFFSEEYRLDYLIHRYPKPLLVWASGIVLGGGWGLLAGASHRVVTETTRMAMPEITIGLFPDVGASWFLRQLPGHTGRFLALTGVQINGSDAVFRGLADHLVRASDRGALFSELPQLPWSSDASANRKLLTETLLKFAHEAAPVAPASNLQRHAELIESFCRGDSVTDAVNRIVSYDGDDAWMKRAVATLAAGSPTTAALSWELQRRTRDLDLASTLRLELIVALQCCARPDFVEGVRALLIDKDNKPRWQPSKLADVTPQWVESHFEAPAWLGAQHPLANL